MSSDNEPPSFPTYGTNDDESGYNAQGDYNKPPSYDAMGREGNSSSELQHNVGANHDLAPNAPSFRDVVERPQMNSEAANGVNLSSAGVQGPSIGSMARGNDSNPSGGVEHSVGVPAPNLSGANGREDSSMGNQGSDAQVNLGMSLVGKNLRSFYPNAYYYKEKDSDK